LDCGLEIGYWHAANSAGLEPKLPGGFGTRFVSGRMTGWHDEYFAAFSTIHPIRRRGFFRGTRVAKQDTP